ncbi:MAG: hypothetical protein R2856_25285 [Caldilineaceae bacterium]
MNSFIVVLPSLLILILSAMTAYVLARFPFPATAPSSTLSWPVCLSPSSWR